MLILKFIKLIKNTQINPNNYINNNNKKKKLETSAQAMHHRSSREFILPIASMFRNQRPNWLYKSQLPTVRTYLEACLSAKECFLLDFMSLEREIAYSQPLILERITVQKLSEFRHDHFISAHLCPLNTIF